jgi:hypothetical protein
MQTRAYRQLGFVSIFSSCGMWVAILFVPILPGTIAQKALLTSSLMIISEVTFWLGIMLVGKEVADRYRQKLNPCYWWQKVNRK